MGDREEEEGGVREREGTERFEAKTPIVSAHASIMDSSPSCNLLMRKEMTLEKKRERRRGWTFDVTARSLITNLLSEGCLFSSVCNRLARKKEKTVLLREEEVEEEEREGEERDEEEEGVISSR
jgi:hypothetical protein